HRCSRARRLQPSPTRRSSDLVGRCWPILTGERGHYELAAGRDPKPFIATIENFANQGGMLTEQLWDEPDLPEAHMKFGCPTGARSEEHTSELQSRGHLVCRLL